MDLQELTRTILTAWPWQLRVAIGHVLPLFVAIWCLWSLRGYWKHKAAVAFIFALGAGRVQVAVQGNPVPMLWFAVLAVMVAVACGKHIKWQALWAGVFFPLWVVDLLLGGVLFDGNGAAMLRAIGGAGPMDALLVVPLFAVLLGQLSRLEVLAWPWVQGKVAKLRARFGKKQTITLQVDEEAFAAYCARHPLFVQHAIKAHTDGKSFRSMADGGLVGGPRQR